VSAMSPGNARKAPGRVRLSMFLDRLRELLEDRDISQAELARGLGVGVATVSEWFTRGRVPQGDVFLQLPALLQVNGHWLLTGEGTRDMASAEQGAYEQGARDVLTELTAALKRIEERYVPEGVDPASA